MSSLSPQPQHETVAILRHPSWHEPNPFAAIPLPAHDLSQYNIDEIIGFTQACRKVFEQLDHPEMGLGINPERLAHINMAVHTLQHATSEEVSTWMLAWKKDLKDAEQHTEALLQQEQERLRAEYQKLAIADKALEATCRDSIQALLTAHHESSTTHVTLPNFQEHTYKVQKTERPIESLFRHAHQSESSSLLVEQIILGGRQNPFAVLPLPQTLLAQLLEAQEQQPDAVNVKQLLLVLKKPLLRLFHSDITHEDRSEQFKKFNTCLKTLEELPSEQCTLLLSNFLKQKQQEKNAACRDLTVGIQDMQRKIFLAERDHQTRANIFTTLTTQIAALGDPKALIRNENARMSLLALSEKIFLVDRYLFTISQRGILSYAPIPQGCSSDKDGTLRLDNDTLLLISQQTFTPCGMLAGSIGKVEKQNSTDRHEIANTMLGLDQATRLSGVNKDIPPVDAHHDSRLIRPLVFLTVLPEAGCITLVPTHGMRRKDNLNAENICSQIKENVTEILRGTQNRNTEFRTIGGIAIAKKRDGIWIAFKDPQTTLVKQWHMERWEELQGKPDELRLLEKINSKLTIEYILELSHQYCSHYLGIKQQREAHADKLKIFEEGLRDNIQKNFVIRIDNKNYYITSYLQSARQGDTPSDISYIELVDIFRKIQKAFPIKS